MQPGVVELTLIVLVVWVAVYLIIGFLGWKFTKLVSLEEFFVAGRTMSWVTLLLILLGATFSGFMFVGLPGLNYKIGMPIFQWIIGYTICVVTVMVVMGYPAILVGRKYGYVSCADLFMDRYESKFLGLVWSILWIIFSVPYMVGQVMAAGVMLEGVTGGVLPYISGIIFIFIVMVIYTFIGGMRGFGWVTAVQALLLCGILLTILGLMNAVTPNGIVGAVQYHVEHNPKFLEMPGVIPYWTLPMALSWWMFGGLGHMTWPHIYPRLYAIRSARSWIYVTVVYSAICMFVMFLHIGLFGTFGRILIPGLKGKEVDLLVSLFLAKYTPTWFAALGTAGALAAIMSTAAAILLSMSSIITKEIYQTWINPKATQKQLVWVGRIGLWIWGIIGIVLGYLRPGLIAIIVAMSMAGLLMLMPPMVAAFWWRRANKYGAIAGPIAGEAVLVYQFARPELSMISWFGFHPAFWGFVACIIVWLIVTYLTPPPSPETQRKFHDYIEKRMFGKVIS